MGPTWVLSAPDGPHVGPMNFAIRVFIRLPRLLTMNAAYNCASRSPKFPIFPIHLKSRSIIMSLAQLRKTEASWWRHLMETFSALLAICAGNSPVTGEFPTQRPVTWSFDIFFDLRLNNQLSKQSWGWWFETLSCLLWHQCNVSCNFLQSFSSEVFPEYPWVVDVFVMISTLGSMFTVFLFAPR